jgi:hypothetical protein
LARSIVVVVDRLIHSAGVDLAVPVTANRRRDVAEQLGQLRPDLERPAELEQGQIAGLYRALRKSREDVGLQRIMSGFTGSTRRKARSAHGRWRTERARSHIEQPDS